MAVPDGPYYFLLSAAIPHQGGDGQSTSNRQSIVDLFAEHGRVGSGSSGLQIWEDERIESGTDRTFLVC